jgi:hypothetical protein
LLACFYLDHRDTRLRLKRKRSPLHWHIAFLFLFIMQASALKILIADGVGNKHGGKNRASLFSFREARVPEWKDNGVFHFFFGVAYEWPFFFRLLCL